MRDKYRIKADNANFRAMPQNKMFLLSIIQEILIRKKDTMKG